MCHHTGFRWGEAGQQELTHGLGARSGSGSGERLSGLCALCCVFPLSVSLLLLFPLFAVLLNCPYPDPPVSACFFPFSSAPQRGEGWPHGTFIAGRSQTVTNRFWCECHWIRCSNFGIGVENLSTAWRWHHRGKKRQVYAPQYAPASREAAGILQACVPYVPTNTVEATASIAFPLLQLRSHLSWGIKSRLM